MKQMADLFAWLSFSLIMQTWTLAHMGCICFLMELGILRKSPIGTFRTDKVQPELDLASNSFQIQNGVVIAQVETFQFESAASCLD